MPEERLQKIISRYGICSRRGAEALIEAGRVRLNGNTARLGDTAIDGEDIIEVDGKVLRREPQGRYLLLNKPRGVVTTMDDEKGRKTVKDLVADCPQRVYPVGRLDLNSEGLLLLTNDGALTQHLTHPSHQVEKVYKVWVSNYREGADRLVGESIVLDGRPTVPAKVRILQVKDVLATLEVTICEGRNRQVRRLCEHAGLTVTRLQRIRLGAITLGRLPVGTWRDLTEDEIESLWN